MKALGHKSCLFVKNVNETRVPSSNLLICFELTFNSIIFHLYVIMFKETIQTKIHKTDANNEQQVETENKFTLV